jgi:hypothetical protein
VGKHRTGLIDSGAPQGIRGSREGHHERARWALQSFAFLASMALVLVTIVDPTAAFAELTRANAAASHQKVRDADQSLTVADSDEVSVVRSDFTTSRIQATAPKVGFPDPGTAKAIAYEMVIARGWDTTQYDCLVALFERESHWNIYSSNKTSGAYGIPQALPGSKMASAGPDWETNPATQITWGLGYIAGRYGDPCGAWASSQSRGWY